MAGGGGQGGKLVMLSESSWSSIPAYTQGRQVLVRKLATKAVVTYLSGKLPKKLLIGGGGGGGEGKRGKLNFFPIEFVGKY